MASTPKRLRVIASVLGLSVGVGFIPNAWRTGGGTSRMAPRLVGGSHAAQEEEERKTESLEATHADWAERERRLRRLNEGKVQKRPV